MEKKTYQTPEMEITRFDAEDIIRTSGLYETEFVEDEAY